MSVDIVNLIETNPITKLNGNYQSKLIEKVKNHFTDYEQQMFVASFYCYLNYTKTDFVIENETAYSFIKKAFETEEKQDIIKALNKAIYVLETEDKNETDLAEIIRKALN